MLSHLDETLKVLLKWKYGGQISIFDRSKGSDSMSEYSWGLNELRTNTLPVKAGYIVWRRILRMFLSGRHSDFIGE